MLTPLDLGYIELQLQPGWSAYARLDIDTANVIFSRDDAICELTLLSAGSINQELNLERLYLELLGQAKNRGLHTDDLAEDFKHEFIAELNDGGNFLIQHSFLRQCGGVIVHALLTGHYPSDEDDVRQMLASLQSRDNFISDEPFNPLPASKAILDWGHVGDLAVFNKDL
jgi:hypothetical protein